MNSVDIICISWANGQTFEKDRPRFVQCVQSRLDTQRLDTQRLATGHTATGHTLTQTLKPRGQIFMAEYTQSAHGKNAQKAAFAYFEQVVKAQPGSSVEMRTSQVTPRCPYICTMIVLTAAADAESPVSEVPLPDAIKGIEIPIMNFGEQDGSTSGARSFVHGPTASMSTVCQERLGGSVPRRHCRHDGIHRLVHSETDTQRTPPWQRRVQGAERIAWGTLDDPLRSQRPAAADA